MSKFVKISFESYSKLLRESLDLLFLESCGVDNWDPGISKKEWVNNNGFDSFESMIEAEIAKCDILTE